MLHRSRTQRVGVTLIELLVVLSIIAILMSLLIAGVMRAMGSKQRTETQARMAAISNAIGTYKSQLSFGQARYIPPGRFDAATRTWQPFRLRNSYPATAPAGEPDQFSFEAQYLQQIFGGGHGLNLNDLGYRDNSGRANLIADLDANQTLTFFLTGIPETDGQGNANFTGFSAHPQQPFTRRSSTSETRRGPILAELGGSGGARKYIVDTSGPGAGFARLLDGYGNPFAYFAAHDGKANSNYGGYNATLNAAPFAMGAVVPYSSAGQFENASGFQIISAGKDGKFGTTGDWKNVGVTGEDDQAHFSTLMLGRGPQ